MILLFYFIWFFVPTLANTNFRDLQNTLFNLSVPTNPLVRSFKSREELLASSFWSHFINRRDLITARNSVIFIEDESNFLVFNEDDQEKGSLLWIPWIKRNLARLHFTEVEFGRDVYLQKSENFPMLTASAELSSSFLQIEREISRGHSIRVNPSFLTLLSILGTGWRIAMESTNSLYIAEKESIICRARPGGRVQLQVSSNMLSFPKARSRKFKYDIQLGVFELDDWELITSSIHHQELPGILMALLARFMLARCVTNETMFEKPDKKHFFEHRIALEQDFSFISKYFSSQ